MQLISFRTWGTRLDLSLQVNAANVSLNLKPQRIASYVEFLNANNLVGTQTCYYTDRNNWTWFLSGAWIAGRQQKHGQIWNLCCTLRCTCPDSFLISSADSITSSTAHIASYSCFHPGVLLFTLKWGHWKEQFMHFLNGRCFCPMKTTLNSV